MTSPLAELLKESAIVSAMDESHFNSDCSSLNEINDALAKTKSDDIHDVLLKLDYAWGWINEFAVFDEIETPYADIVTSAVAELRCLILKIEDYKQHSELTGLRRDYLVRSSFPLRLVAGGAK